jgi:hypothetical protein
VLGTHWVGCRVLASGRQLNGWLWLSIVENAFMTDVLLIKNISVILLSQIKSCWNAAARGIVALALRRGQ